MMLKFQISDFVSENDLDFGPENPDYLKEFYKID